jgi:RHS repeat-associated protein
LDLSRPPTDRELMAAGQLGGVLSPTHDGAGAARADQMRLAFGRAIQAWNRHEYKSAYGLFARFRSDYPDSPWAAEASLHMACEARFNGRYREADELFSSLIETHGASQHPGARHLRDKALSRQAVLNVLEGNLDAARRGFAELKTSSEDWRLRTYASGWLVRIAQQERDRRAFLRCGVQALAELLHSRGKTAAAETVSALDPASLEGHSLSALSDLASEHGVATSARRVDLAALDALPTPAILHVPPRQQGAGHYWVLRGVRGDRVVLYDPQARRRFEQSRAEVGQWWQGKALVFASSSQLPGDELAAQESAATFGGCCGVQRPEAALGNPGVGSGCGAPVWGVNPLNMNLYVSDTPLWYRPAYGPAVEVQLSYNSLAAIAQHEPVGNKWSLSFASYLVVDPGGTVTVFMPDGRRDTHVPNEAGGFDPPRRTYSRLTRLGDNHYELRLPDDSVYEYDLPAGTASMQPFLVRIGDANGHSLRLAYNQHVQLATITDAAGGVTGLRYDGQGRLIEVVDPHQRAAKLGYDDAGNLVSITDMAGYQARLTYDDDRYITSIGDDQGTWQFYIEPADGIRVSDSAERYPPHGAPMWESYRITITNPLGAKEEYFYLGGAERRVADAWYVSPEHYVEPAQNGGRGNAHPSVPKTLYWMTTTLRVTDTIAAIQRPDGTGARMRYDSAGRIIKIVETNREEAATGTVEFSWNARGQMKSMRDADGVATTFHYADNQVDLTAIENPLGTVRIEYNQAHQPVATVDARGLRAEFRYNERGQLIAAEDAAGRRVEYQYGADGRLAAVLANGGEVGRYVRDALGRVTEVTGASGLTLKYAYNNLDVLKSVTYPDGRTTEVEFGSCPWQPAQVTGPGGERYQYGYDAAKQLISVIQPGGLRTGIAYNRNGQAESITDGNGQKTSYRYDAAGRPERIEEPERGATALTYDKRSRVETRTDARGVVTTYGYDGSNRLISISYSDETPEVRFTYDAHDRVLAMIDALGTTKYSYDVGRAVSTVDGPWEDDTISYEYDQAGRVREARIAGGTPITYGYDEQGRLASVARGEAVYRYSYAGASQIITGLTRPSGVTTTYSHDDLKRLTGVRHGRPGAEDLERYTYEYNERHLLAAEDKHGVLEAEVAPSASQVRHINEQNQVTGDAVAGTRYEYDAAGNLTRGVTPRGEPWTATYDGEQRLASLTYTDGSTGKVVSTSYQYSGTGLLGRVVRREGTQVVEDVRLVRRGLLAAQERDQNNRTVREYLWGRGMGGGIGGLLSVRYSGSDYDYVYDGRGNVSAVLDGQGRKQVEYAYDVYGVRTGTRGTFDQPYQFSTKRYDARTGLVYFGYRFYVPALGRWLTPDPIGAAGGLNLYEYVGGNPVMAVDPTGEFAAAGALIGGLEDMAIEMGLQLIANGGRLSCIRWGDVGRAGLEGALMGMVGGLLIDGLHALRTAGRVSPCSLCFAEDTAIATADGPVDIEDVELGDRVLTGGVAECRATEVEPATWRRVRALAANPDDPADSIELELLRPVEWIEATGAEPGAVIQLVIDEMGVAGPARIVAVEPAPAIEDGDGDVVLATITHRNARLVALRFAGSAEVLEPTAQQRMYSVDRAAWVPAGQLRPGERLLAAGGGEATIAEVRPLPGPRQVYNIQVEWASTYFAGALAVLSHNANPCGLGPLIDDVFAAGDTNGADLFRRARDALARSSASARDKADAFEVIAGRINQIDDSWGAVRGPASNAAGFFTGEGRPFGLAIDHSGRVWGTLEVTHSVSFGPGGALIDFTKWRLF